MVGKLAAFPERQPVLKRMAEAGERRGNLETSGEKGRKSRKGRNGTLTGETGGAMARLFHQLLLFFPYFK